MINVQDVTVGYYKEIPVLKGITINAKKSEITTVIGPNGSGKSTLLKTIYGLLKPIKGRILYENEDITGCEPYTMIWRGIGFMFQERAVFPQMTILENLKLGGWIFGRKQEKLKEALEGVFKKYPIFKERKNEKAGKLSGGQQRILEIARFMISKPKLMLMDEPSAHLAPKVVKEVYKEIKRLKNEGVTILLVDQNVESAVSVADYVYVLKESRIVDEGCGSEFRRKLKELIKGWFLA